MTRSAGWRTALPASARLPEDPYSLQRGHGLGPPPRTHDRSLTNLSLGCLSRAPTASLRDRLRRLLTEPVRPSSGVQLPAPTSTGIRHRMRPPYLSVRAAWI